MIGNSVVPTRGNLGEVGTSAHLSAVVAIPVKDEAERIGACLDALACQRDELGFILRSLENDKCSQTDILSIDFRSLIAGFLRKHPTPRLATSAASLKQLERVLSKPGTALPKLHLKKVADWHKRDRALLSLG